MNDPVIAGRRTREDVLISVVLPVYNEAQVLPTLLRRVVDALATCHADYEMIFVNDGSSDESPRILDRLAAENARVRAVHFVRNFGHQAAVQAGLAHARGDAVVLMDSDMQDAPEAIPRFVHQWRAGYDVVYAIRTQRKENLLKRLLFAAFHRLLARIASIRIPADAGIFGLVDRRAARQIVALGERDRYFPGLRSWVAIFSFSSFPLTIFYAIAALAALTFVLLGSYSLFCKLFTHLAIPGWTSHILTGCFFGALNALGICILGEYVVRIYDQVRARPLYLVDRTVNMGLDSHQGEDPQRRDTPYDELLEQASQLLEVGTRPPNPVPPSDPLPAAADLGADSDPVVYPIGND
jgi:glycosyltransferase involved in cell wall biosynthesis